VTLATRTNVLVLQHPREAHKAVGTARIAKLCLPSAEIAVGVTLAEHAAVRAAQADPERELIVLYPGPGARDLARERPDGPATLVVIDGTWAHARALVRNNPWLAKLPRYAFTPAQPSEYQIRREPKPHYVSTIEALAEALTLLENDGRDFAALREPFRAMVNKQLEYAARSLGGRKRERRRDGSNATARLPQKLASPNLVCLMGEANAWPHDRELGRPAYPHELVQLLLVRVHEPEAGLELFARPRAPLASSPITHGKLTRERLLGGLSFVELCQGVQTFLRPDDVVCTWGPYVAKLFRHEGGVLPESVLDLRKVMGDFTRARPGTLEETTQALGLEAEALGEGRAGRRLALLLSVARYLSAHASALPLTPGSASCDGAQQERRAPI